MENLSEAARTALINAGTNRLGAPLVGRIASGVWPELRNAGLIGSNGGLTRKGSITRSRIMDEALKEAFGE